MTAPVLITDETLGLSLRDARAAFERAYLIAQVRRFKGVKQAAYAAGLERSYFHRKLRELGVEATPRDLRSVQP